MGPQHPSTHGVFRLRCASTAKRSSACKLDIGYLHRSFEKFGETWQFPQIAPFVDRNDYLAGTAQRVRLLPGRRAAAGIGGARAGRVHPGDHGRAQPDRQPPYLVWHLRPGPGGDHALSCGLLRSESGIYDLNEVVTGGRMFPQFFRLGGVRNDFPESFSRWSKRRWTEIEASLEEYHGLVTGNPIFEARTKGIGRLSAEEAIAFGCSGPCCAPRASPTTCARPIPTRSTTGSTSTCPWEKTETSTTATWSGCGRWRRASRSCARRSRRIPGKGRSWGSSPAG